MDSVKIQLPAELFALAESSHFDGEVAVDLLEIGPDDYRFDTPIAWEADVTNTGSAFLVEGRAQASATCACARCLEDVSCDFDSAIEGYFLISADMQDDEEYEDLEEGEFDILPDDHTIDLMPLIVAAIMMDAPDQPLCTPDCKGLCQQCGANLNEGPCGCEELPDPTHPFAALADFKFDD